MIYEECPCGCGRHNGAYCENREIQKLTEDNPMDWVWEENVEYEDPYDNEPGSVKASDKQVNGDHYRSMAIQPSEFIYRNNLDWYEGNAVKYICRHRRKGGQVDVEKAIHYLELLLEAEYAKSVTI